MKHNPHTLCFCRGKDCSGSKCDECKEWTEEKYCIYIKVVRRKERDRLAKRRMRKNATLAKVRKPISGQPAELTSWPIVTKTVKVVKGSVNSSIHVSDSSVKVFSYWWRFWA